MSTCVPTPVSTEFSTVTVDTITTYSLSTLAVPPVVTTRTYCENEAVLLDSTVCLKTGTKTGTETVQCTFRLLMISTPLSRVFLAYLFFFLLLIRSTDVISFPAISIHSSRTAAFN